MTWKRIDEPRMTENRDDDQPAVDLWRRDRAVRRRRLLRFALAVWICLATACSLTLGPWLPLQQSGVPLLATSIPLAALLLAWLSWIDRGRYRLIQCQGCGRVLTRGIRSCPHCGNRVAHCRRCGYRLAASDSAQCSECGTPI